MHQQSARTKGFLLLVAIPHDEMKLVLPTLISHLTWSALCKTTNTDAMGRVLLSDGAKVFDVSEDLVVDAVLASIGYVNAHKCRRLKYLYKSVSEQKLDVFLLRTKRLMRASCSRQGLGAYECIRL